MTPPPDIENYANKCLQKIEQEGFDPAITYMDELNRSLGEKLFNSIVLVVFATLKRNDFAKYVIFLSRVFGEDAEMIREIDETVQQMIVIGGVEN